jgi:hypothetical protein
MSSITASPQSPPGGEHGLDALVPIAGAGLAVEHGGADGPRELAQPGHAGVPQ